MLSCDYNGWNDAPEEEREWADEYLESPGVIGSDRILSAWNQETMREGEDTIGPVRAQTG